MSCFTTMSAVNADSDLDLTKHVNFTAGMILGVDDFTQEFAYLAGRDRWLARDAIGYGTISGLSVRIEKDAQKGHRVMIQPGVAISPRGQFICVPAAQCAYLNEWLAAAKPADLLKWIRTVSVKVSPPVSPSPSGKELPLYVVLCYRDCLTDEVPIPGEPCRSEDELMSPSRVKDDFSLELRFEPPKQPEEEAVRNYSEWLKQIKISDTTASTPIDDFLKAIRDKWLSPSGPPVSSPPLTLQIHPNDVAEYIRLAFRLWVTELRNVLGERKTGCASEMTGGAKLDDCILLAELHIPLESVSPGWKVSDTRKAEVNEEKRPFLVHLRMLQEWMISEPNDHGALTGLADDDHPQYLLADGSRGLKNDWQSGGKLIRKVAAGKDNGDVVIFEQAVKVNDAAGGDLSGKYPKPAIAKLQGKSLSAAAPAEGQLLVFRSNKWIAETPAPIDHGTLTGLGDDDHPQYLLANGSRGLTKDWESGGKLIRKVAAGKDNGDVVIFEQAVKHTDDAGGDLSGKFKNLLITKLQGKAVDAKDPKENDVLLWNGVAWVPKPLPTQPPQETKPFTILPLATITRRDNNAFEIWFNIDAPDNLAVVEKYPEGQDPKNIIIEGEDGSPTDFLQQIPAKISNTNFRNVFFINLQKPEMSYMRFKFILGDIKVRVEGAATSISLAEYAKKNSIKFMGSQEKSATIFVRGVQAST